MAKFDDLEGISDVLAAPLGDVIAAVGRSVAEAQQAMDGQALEHFRAIYDESVAAFEELRSIGYQPTWYQIPEATAEIAIALTVTGSRSSVDPTGPRRLAIFGAPVDGGYQSKFGYNVQASSSVKFRIVPVPPPAAAARLRIVPDLTGLTLARARTMLAELEIAVEVTGAAPAESAVVVGQRPAAGSVLPAESTVLITTEMT